MGKVSDKVCELLNRQVKERGIVVWYDSEKVYDGLAKRLQIPETTVLCYENGFFPLRERMEQFLEFVTEDGRPQDDCGVPPKLIVYVPKSRSETGFALIEAESVGAVVEPGAPTADRNSRLSSLVEQVFNGVAPEKAAHVARQTEEGLLTLAELDQMAEEAGTVTTGALKLIFGAASPVDVILSFLAGNEFDVKLEKKHSLSELAVVAREELGLDVELIPTATELRTAIRRHLLLCELIQGLPEEGFPPSLSTIALPRKPVQFDTIRHVLNVWRQRLDLQEAYRETAENVQAMTQLDKAVFPTEALRGLETFPFIEYRLLLSARNNLAQRDTDSPLALAKERRASFWSRVYPEISLRWSLVEVAARLLQVSGLICDALKRRKFTAEELITAYTRHGEPWMLLDRYARHLESRYVRCETFGSTDDAGMDELMHQCRVEYANTLAVLAEAYSGALEREGFTPAGFDQQSQTFRNAVAPLLKDGGKVAYFLVDALRYEMADELCEGLSADFTVHLEPALGQLPGITSVGMAALLPAAENGLALEAVGGRMRVCVQGETVNDRSARVTWFQEKSDSPTKVFKLGDIVRLTPKRKRELAEAQLVIVTSQEIDRHGEEGGEDEETRLYMDEVLEKLRRGLRNLVQAGIMELVIAADHGFIFAEALESGLKMDPPGGKTIALHDRVWIGQGGVAADGFFRVNASDLELGGPLELAFPKGLGIFKVPGGGCSYFHGGASLQEQIIPVCRLTAKAPKRSAVITVNLKLQLAKPKITNRFFSVTVSLEAEGLFTDVAKRVRLEILSGKDEVGHTAMAAYGFEEGSREIVVDYGKPNSVTIMISETKKLEHIEIRAVDCESQLLLASLTGVPVELAI
ncbi:PglZ domain-containing protein [Geobacter sulfurreducens]|uniref:PglZ domain protein n=1 Tax=Geobacter sulfurreducens (strain ATCC 51573 / DSM 12127 / PCA) TaxID=243231 RepID=Q74BD5_GEOSL|nr:PglZ domain-containing protein [Geobacter sulfurreducens]AAR35482.1 PglZ domain protein [Geobacter sulfurreducens PCA]UAC02831.1 PglZ domain-containing protein [Geobacter sulfurreducens]HCD97614.1 PglZ domain-containing protein [Geobacter sulfurreducens]